MKDQGFEQLHMASNPYGAVVMARTSSLSYYGHIRSSGRTFCIRLFMCLMLMIQQMAAHIRGLLFR